MQLSHITPAYTSVSQSSTQFSGRFKNAGFAGLLIGASISTPAGVYLGNEIRESFLDEKPATEQVLEHDYTSNPASDCLTKSRLCGVLGAFMGLPIGLALAVGIKHRRRNPFPGRTIIGVTEASTNSAPSKRGKGGKIQGHLKPRDGNQA